ncbi:uncharacterized protein [Nicotiana sylvestris]|uniref:uncharacterized protein n=1 Tax=Nicotiana sylvestris TaxID=4096 RepID=UPI00388C5DC2
MRGRPILEKTPYELLRGRKPNIIYLRAFECKCFVHNNDKEVLGKFDNESDKGILLGYSPHSKAYKVFNKRTMCVEENVYVIFDESNNLVEKGLQDNGYDIGLTGEGAPKVPEPQHEDGSRDHKEVDSDHEEQEEERTTLISNQTDEAIPTETIPLGHSLEEQPLGMQIRHGNIKVHILLTTSTLILMQECKLGHL